jgi:hypothetical protein
MIQYHSGNCTEKLLDMLCYEAYRERLSPEMEVLLADHLAECEQCRSKVLGLRQLLGCGLGTSDNLSFLLHSNFSKVS